MCLPVVCCKVCHWRQNLVGWRWRWLDHKGLKLDFSSETLKRASLKPHSSDNHILTNIQHNQLSFQGWICGECGEEQVHLQHVHCGITKSQYITPTFIFDLMFQNFMKSKFIQLPQSRHIVIWEPDHWPFDLKHAHCRTANCHLDFSLFSSRAIYSEILLQKAFIGILYTN